MTDQSNNQLDQIVASCERVWRAGGHPDIDEILRSNPDVDRQSLLIELVHLELEQRLAAGKRIRVEEYLERYPTLTANREVILGLICSEFEMRRHKDPKLDVSEYSKRFPWCRELLPTALAGPPRPRPGQVAVRLNCPHCQNPIQVVDDRLHADDVLCPSCGSSFKLAVDRTQSWKPERLPRLGKFELLEAVGRGAFGTVYRAHDTELDRIVAVKLPRSGSLATQEDEDRFIREARSVAQLRHPNIVSVFETGRSDQFPYIVSEFVEGVTLSDSLTGKRPSFRESADLVSRIAEALQYAHEQGVVHRDIKPSNIMIDDAGRPHVMDFGLARRDAGEITMTLEGQVLGTPAYMSPEQASGEGHRVDGRSDVYSLGVILYELITKELPFHGSQRMLLHQVLRDEPRKPRSLNDRIPRDLETICLKAMEKQPSRRFSTAKALADDLTLWLTDRPIHARPTGRLEQGWRWCHRNPALSATAAALFVALTFGFVGVSWQWWRAERNRAEAVALADQERDARAEVELSRRQAVTALSRESEARSREEKARVEAERQRSLAETNFRQAKAAVDDYLTKVSQTTLLDRLDLQPLRKQLISSALEYYEQFAKQSTNDATLLAEVAATHLRLGEICYSLGDVNDALPHMEEALRIIRRLTTTKWPDEKAWKSRLAGILTGPRFYTQPRVYSPTDAGALRSFAAIRGIHLIYLDFMNSHPDLIGFKRDVAIGTNYLATVTLPTPRKITLLEEANALWKDVVAVEPIAVNYHGLGVTSLHLAQRLEDDNRPEDAIVRARDCVEQCENLARLTALTADDQRYLASAYLCIANCCHQLGRTDEAARAQQQALELNELMQSQNSGSNVPMLDIAAGQNLMAIGTAQEDRADFDAAIQSFRKAATNFQKAGYAEKYGWALARIGITLRRKGSYPSAVVALQDALEQRINALGSDHTSIAWTRNELAWAFRGNGQTSEAIAELRHSIQIYKQASDKKYQPNLAGVLLDLSHILRDEKKDLQAAETIARQSLALRWQLYRAKDVDFTWVMHGMASLAWTLHVSNQDALAESIYLEALKEASSVFGDSVDDQYWPVDCKVNLANLLRDRGDVDGASKLYREILASPRKQLPTSHQLVKNARQGLVELLKKQHDSTAIKLTYEELLNSLRAEFGTNSDQVRRELHEFAMTLQELGLYDAAVQEFTNELAVARSLQGDDNSVVAQCLYNIGRTFQLMEDSGTAVRYLKAALGMRERLFGRDHRDVAWCHFRLGEVQAFTKDYGAAEEHLRAAIEIRRKIGIAEKSVALCLAELGRTLRAAKKYAEAVAAFREYLDIYKASEGDVSAYSEWGHSMIGSTFLDKGDLLAAEASYSQSLTDLKSIYGTTDHRVADRMRDLATVMAKQKRFAEAETLHRERIAIYRNVAQSGSEASTHTDLADANHDLGHLLDQSHRYVDAAKAFAEGLDCEREARGPRDEQICRHAFCLLRAKMKAGAFSEYQQICQSLLEIFSGTHDAKLASDLAWCCALLPETVADGNKLAELAEVACLEFPTNQRYARAHALALYRAGQYVECLRRISEAMVSAGDGGAAFDWLLLAMALHRIGDVSGAHIWFNQGKAALERESKRPLESAERTSSDDQIAECTVLRIEAETILATVSLPTVK